jgi:hypothetical protein
MGSYEKLWHMKLKQAEENRQWRKRRRKTCDVAISSGCVFMTSTKGKRMWMWIYKIRPKEKIWNRTEQTEQKNDGVVMFFSKYNWRSTWIYLIGQCLAVSLYVFCCKWIPAGYRAVHFAPTIKADCIEWCESVLRIRIWCLFDPGSGIGFSGSWISYPVSQSNSGCVFMTLTKGKRMWIYKIRPKEKIRIRTEQTEQKKWQSCDVLF